MTANPIVIPRLHPTARCVAVTSGKGGAAKSTTVAAVAARLSTDGVNVVVVDLDLAAPNAHIIAGVPDTARLAVDMDTVEVILPWSTYGYRVATPILFEDNGSVSSVAALCRYVNDVDVVLFDLPGGWTDAQSLVMAEFVDDVIAVSPPTDTALSDHAAHIGDLIAARDAARLKVQEKDRRRKVTFPDTGIWSVETLADHIGTLPNGDVVTVRRLDAVSPSEAASRFAACSVPFRLSVPAAADISTLAATSEIGDLAALIRG